MKFTIGDLETYLEMFLYVCYDVEEKRWYRFEVSKWKNQLDEMLCYIESKDDVYFVFYNGLRFDTQVLEFIIRNNQNWINNTRLEICEIISQFANDVIDDMNYGMFSKYRESDLSFKTIDPFEIAHFSNKNRLVSLKRLEFEMDMEDLEETPVAFNKINLTIKDRLSIIHYCNSDVKALYKFHRTILGDTEHPLYMDNNQVELRLNIEEEFGIECLNFSDSKIGDEMIKKFYCQKKGISISELPKKGTFRREIKISNCIAPYIKFQTKELKDFLKRIRKGILGIKDEFKESIHFYDTTYSFMKGGLHSENKPEIYEEGNNYFIIDWDVSSYYPAIIINNGKYPAHLGKYFLRGYEQMFNRRLELKPQAKSNKKIKGIVGALKLAVNSVYGKSSDMQNWMYDRQLTMFTTITGELSLMMLIEAYELAGINVFSANTDGITVKIHKSKMDKMFEINKWWSELTRYELERTDYKKIIFSTVNDYLAIYPNGGVKKKGDFLTDFELHKNKSARVVPIALEQYYVNGTPIADTIKNHTNIYDFALRQKSSKNFHYEGIQPFSNQKSIYNKLIRYYVSSTGEKILKIKNLCCTTNAAPISQVHAGEWLCTVVNKLPSTHPLDNINYNFYIAKANRIVDKIRYEGRKHKPQDLNQLSLF